jgi:hypothetical protein
VYIQDSSVASTNLQTFTKKQENAPKNQPQRGYARPHEHGSEEDLNGGNQKDNPSCQLVKRNRTVGTGQELPGEHRLRKYSKNMANEHDAEDRQT